jgi:hypothetical protein
MLFLYYECEGNKTVEELGKMTLPQFRGAMQASKVVTVNFPAERVDEIFSHVATSESTLNRKFHANSAVSSFTLLDFLVAIIHVAAHWYDAEIKPHRAGNPPLSSKLEILLTQCLSMSSLPELQRKAERFNNAGTPGAARILEAGRR